MKNAGSFLLMFFIVSCNMSEKKNDSARSEILKTERDFSQMARDSGLSKAFVFFADENAVISRRDTLLKGKESIWNFYHNRSLENVRLEWEPEFADVSSSGDLGYTYGKYFYSATDTAGKIHSFNGIFHTVWKKQKDGSWKYVYD